MREMRCGRELADRRVHVSEYTIAAIKKAGGEAVLKDAHHKFPKSEVLGQLHNDLKDLDKCIIC